MRILEDTELGAGQLALISDVRIEESIVKLAHVHYSMLLAWRQVLDVALDYGLELLAKRAAIEIIRVSRPLKLSS